MSTSTSVLSNSDPAFKERLAKVIRRKAPDWELEDALKIIEDDTDIFEILDSIMILDLLLETESEIEAVAGKYIALGNESLMDGSKSPLRRFDSWADFVAKAMAGE